MGLRQSLGLQRRNSWPAVLAVNLLAVILAVLFLLPFLSMVGTAFKPLDKVFRLPPRIFAFPLRFENFAEAWSKFLPFNRFLLNTLFIAVLSTIGNLTSSSLVSFSFARLSWPGRDVFFIIILATLMLPYQVTLIPVFILFKTIGWVNTYLPIIVPTFFGNAFFIFFMRQFITSIPFELDSAARIDGASTFTIFGRILMPLCTAPLATVAIFSFIWNWDELVRPLIYLNREKLYTITLGMTMFKNQTIVYWNYLMALAILAMVPPLIIFALAQKWFTQGITITGLKG